MEYYHAAYTDIAGEKVLLSKTGYTGENGYELYIPYDKAVKMTFRHTFVPILMSALTTMAGFLSLSAAIVRPITEFGIFSTLGIFFAIYLSSYLIGDDKVRKETGVDKVWSEYSIKGNGVIVAILDRGIDYTHPDFLNEDGLVNF